MDASKWVSEYLDQVQTSPSMRVALIMVDAALAKFGLTWATVGPMFWSRVFERLSAIPDSSLLAYHYACRYFCDWLVATGRLDHDPYGDFFPVLGDTVPIHSGMRYPKSFEHLLDMTSCVASPQMRLALCLMWHQIPTRQLALLRGSEHVIFYTQQDDPCDVNEFKPEPGASALISESKDVEAPSVRLSNVELLRLLQQVVAASTSGYVFEHGGKPYTHSSLRSAAGRALKVINAKHAMSMTLKTVAKGGAYYTAYTHWKEYHMPFVYTAKGSLLLADLLGLHPGSERFFDSVIRFQSFLDYARDVQGEPL